jgi:hypothetical protein
MNALNGALCAGMSGVCCAVGGREAQLGDGFIQGLAAFVGERGLDQAFERCTGIATPEQTRDHDHELAELGLPAFMGLAIAFDQTAHPRDLHGERIIRARGRRHQVEPIRQPGLFAGEAQGAAAQGLELRQRVKQQEAADRRRLDDSPLARGAIEEAARPRAAGSVSAISCVRG